MNYRFAFVILHYLGVDDTIECVKSIMNIDSEYNFDIVIVDNGSYNKSGIVLHKQFDSIDRIHIVDLDQNLGFAKGNNIGYNYAKEVLKADFIIMLNNDTIIDQKNILNKIISLYNTNCFDVLGPDIISLKDHGHQNPSKFTMDFEPSKISSFILKNNLFLILSYFFGFDIFIKYLYRKIKSSKSSFFESNNAYKYEKKNVLLHGSCLIFSSNYIKRFNGLFDKTFLYLEENILYYIAQKENLLLLYTPEITIFHKEDSSTNIQQKVNVKKRRLIYKNLVRSAKELLQIINDESIYKRNILC